MATISFVAPAALLGRAAADADKIKNTTPVRKIRPAMPGMSLRMIGTSMARVDFAHWTPVGAAARPRDRRLDAADNYGFRVTRSHARQQG
jgi:hypothetical protein